MTFYSKDERLTRISINISGINQEGLSGQKYPDILFLFFSLFFSPLAFSAVTYPAAAAEKQQKPVNTLEERNHHYCFGCFLRAKNPIANFLEITEDGKCLWQYSVLPVCPGEGEIFDVFYHRCEIEYTNESSGSQQYCEDFEGETDIELNERGDGCVKFYLIDPNVIECDVGILNEQSGMYEIRLGSGANKKASLIFSFSFLFFHHDFEPLCKMRVT